MRRALRCARPPGGHVVLTSACGLTGPGQGGGVAAHASAPADHLQPVQTSCSQAREHAAVCSRRRLLPLHQLPHHLVVLRPAARGVLSLLCCDLGDAVEGHVVDVDVAVRGPPGEGEGGGVGGGDGELTDCSRTCTQRGRRELRRRQLTPPSG